MSASRKPAAPQPSPAVGTTDDLGDDEGTAAGLLASVGTAEPVALEEPLPTATVEATELIAKDPAPGVDTEVWARLVQAVKQLTEIASRARNDEHFRYCLAVGTTET